MIAEMPQGTTSLRRYGAAVVTTALALLGANVLDVFLHVQTNLLFVAAVAVSSWYGGRGAGVLASALSLLVITTFHRESPATTVPGAGEVVYLATFLFVTFVIGATTEALRHARGEAETRAAELAQLTTELEEQMEEVRTLSEHLQESNDNLSGALAAAEGVASRATKLHEVTAALSRAETMDDVADVVLGRGLGVVEGERGLLAQVDGERIEMIRTSGYPADAETRVRELALDDDAPLSIAVRTGKPVWIRSRDEFRAQFPWAYERFHAASTVQAHVALPLTHGDQVVGALSLSFIESSALGAADHAFTMLLAQAAADALFRARSYDAERAARRDAEMLAQARADVLGIVAHDLRNPLNVIGSSSQVLMELDVPSADRKKMLEITQRSVRRMNRLIGDLLDATRLRAGRLTLDLADVDVGDILREAEEMCGHEAAERHVELTTIAPAQGQVVCVDQGRVLQALGNLIGNALKFTDEGGHVTVSARPDGEEIVLSVEDTGPGITPEQQTHLFDRFWQARDADRRGVGLGLTITKQIVEAHGGRIWIESTPGTGSTFSFALPLAH